MSLDEDLEDKRTQNLKALIGELLSVEKIEDEDAREKTAEEITQELENQGIWVAV
mgnify:FL=1